MAEIMESSRKVGRLSPLRVLLALAIASFLRTLC